MKILFLNWKDWTHPQAGGAEQVLFELAKRLVADGHQVTLLTARHKNSLKNEVLNGVTIIRKGGNRYLHSFIALVYFIKNLRGKFDAVVEVVNTAPYFAAFFDKHSKYFLFYHQLAREIWHFETKWPLSFIGYYTLEPIATRLMAKTRRPVITVSESTRKDLINYGFKAEDISIISEGIEIEPVKDLSKIKKYKDLTLLSLGSIRPMKRTLDQVKAFELAKQSIPKLKLKVAGDYRSDYGEKVLRYINKSPYVLDIEVLGRVSKTKKVELMQKCHLLLVTSIKEGWGLVVTEANSQGTPAIVYDVDGLRDSVKHSNTGLVCNPSPEHLASAVVELLNNSVRYSTFQKSTLEYSKSITFDRSCKDFNKILGGEIG